MIAVKENDFDTIVQLVKANYPLIIKTDTVWGILSSNQQVLYDIKQRPMNKPFVRLVSSFKPLHNLDDNHISFLNKFWPGDVTVIKNGIAYRMPKDKTLIRIINTFGDRIFYCTSANIHGGEVINDVSQVAKVFEHWTDNIAVVIPPKCKDLKGEPSTIIDIDKWKILRSGSAEREINLWIYKNILIPYQEQSQLDKNEHPQYTKYISNISDAQREKYFENNIGLEPTPCLKKSKKKRLFRNNKCVCE